MAILGAFTKNNLNKQGFGKLDDRAKSRYALPLRFTPAVCTALIVIGLVLQSPIWIGSMALVALSGALFPSGMLHGSGLQLWCSPFIRSAAAAAYAKAATIFLPSLHHLSDWFSRILLLWIIGAGSYPGRNGCHRSSNPHYNALVSWIVVV